DYNGDGTLDLFVGGRAIPAAYPKPASSSLYRNVGGTYVMDTVNTRTLADIGMVSAAMFADLDGDGHPDLVLAREWGSIAVFFNRNGKFVRAPASLGLDKWTSRWIGVAAGDLDGDGRLDLVATSWGRNTMTPVDTAHPLSVVYGPFGGNSETEPLLAQRDPRTNVLAPLNSYARVRSIMEDLPVRVRSFAAYADASVDTVLGLQKALTHQQSIVTLDNMVFLNRGDHFEAHPLPTEAQFAPAS